MPSLASPHPRYQQSFLACAQELVAGGESEWTGLTVVADERYPAQLLAGLTEFSTFTQRLCDLALPQTGRPEGIVAMTSLWWVDGDEFLGRVAIRHELTDWLRDFGGHVGYVVRPRERRRGHASAMLAAALPIAHSLGIDPALVTCDTTNIGSRRVIESKGGIFEDQRGEKLRFWLPTSSSGVSVSCGHSGGGSR